MVNFSLFLQEIESLILGSELNEANEIYLENFNIWVDDIRNNDAQNFLRLLNNFSLVNLVNKPTYNSGQTSDLVITKNHHSLVKSLNVDTTNTFFYHRNINFHLNLNMQNLKENSSGSEKRTFLL